MCIRARCARRSRLSAWCAKCSAIRELSDTACGSTSSSSRRSRRSRPPRGARPWRPTASCSARRCSRARCRRSAGSREPAHGRARARREPARALPCWGAARRRCAARRARAYSGPKASRWRCAAACRYFGDAGAPHAKWLALARVLADPSSAGASYVDVRLPDRPAAGFPPGVRRPPPAPRAKRKPSCCQAAQPRRRRPARTVRQARSKRSPPRLDKAAGIEVSASRAAVGESDRFRVASAAGRSANLQAKGEGARRGPARSSGEPRKAEQGQSGRTLDWLETLKVMASVGRDSQPIGRELGAKCNYRCETSPFR